MTYEAKTVTATMTPTVMVAADADVDREIIITNNSGGQPLRVGFNATDGALHTSWPFRFVLPADEDLYAWVDTGTTNVGVIATKL